jgi:hypothetical protein
VGRRRRSPRSDEARVAANVQNAKAIDLYFAGKVAALSPASSGKEKEQLSELQCTPEQWDGTATPETMCGESMVFEISAENFATY